MSLQRSTFPLPTLRCAAESVAVEHLLRAVRGVAQVFVNPVTEMAYVEYDTDRCDEDSLRAALETAGYAVTPLQRLRAEPRRREEGGVRRLMRIALGAFRRRARVAPNQNREKTR